MIAGLVCVLLGAIDLTVIAAILPQMIPDLGVNTADIDRYIWAVNGYLVAYIVAIPLFGRMSDIIGRQRAFIICLTLFLIGSVLCGRADGLSDLVIGRTVQGFGGGGILPVTIALAGDTLPRRLHLAGIGIVGAAETVGWMLGPLYGAGVVDLLPVTSEAWRWVFWINVPFLLAALALVLRSFPRDSTQFTMRNLGRLDGVGVVLLTVGLVAINLALVSSGEVGAQVKTGLRALGGTPNPLADQVPWLLGIAVITLVSFVVWSRRVRDPLLPIDLLRTRRFLAVIGGNFLVGAVLMVAMVNIPVFVALLTDPEDISGVTALLLAPFTLAIAATSFAAGRIAAEVGERRVAFIGVTLTTIGCIALYFLIDRSRSWTLVPGLVVAGIGLGLVLPPLASIPVASAPVADRGGAASAALMFRLLGMTLGASALTALGVRRLQTLTSQVEPIIRGADESTAMYLDRQRQFIEDHAIPISVQVIQETFLVAAGIATMTMLPLWIIGQQHRPDHDARGSSGIDMQ
jgi:MFS family permease